MERGGDEIVKEEKKERKEEVSSFGFSFLSFNIIDAHSPGVEILGCPIARGM